MCNLLRKPSVLKVLQLEVKHLQVTHTRMNKITLLVPSVAYAKVGYLILCEFSQIDLKWHCIFPIIVMHKEKKKKRVQWLLWFCCGLKFVFQNVKKKKNWLREMRRKRNYSWSQCKCCNIIYLKTYLCLSPLVNIRFAFFDLWASLMSELKPGNNTLAMDRYARKATWYKMVLGMLWNLYMFQ